MFTEDITGIKTICQWLRNTGRPVMASEVETLLREYKEERAARMKFEKRNEESLDIIFQFGGNDGVHHKQWVLNRAVEELLDRASDDTEYKEWIAEYRSGEDGPETYSWDEGVAP